MRLTDAHYKEMAEAYTNGETLAKLAETFGVSIPTMSKYVTKGGATLRPRGQRRKVKLPLSVPNTPEMNQALDAMADAAMGGYYEPGTASVPVTRTILPLE